ncbi:MAG TPA: RNA polymerase sigma factor [Thermoanaerobaculia bacterium]|nr:RNA polymerase sigma factor [Thermoanaerobaculia bacterium]
MNRDNLDALLGMLDPDRNRAAEKYEAIRRKLIRLFEWRGCKFPEELTDVTLDRVARRMSEGVDPSDPLGYFYGVAHLVYKEEWRRVAREQKAINSGDWPPPSQPEGEPDDHRLSCLKKCLEQLPADQRHLLLEYHKGEEGNIRNRKRLADELGIPINALRIRVHRVRRKLEDCIESCLPR